MVWGKKAKRLWSIISHVGTVLGLGQALGIWKVVGGLVGIVMGVLISLLSSFPLWAWALAVVLGIALGLFIVNEVASTRLRRRHGIVSGTNRSQTTPILNSENKRDALEHFLVEDKQRRSLTILDGLPEKPIVYPLVLRNTRPIPIDIVGYEVMILWDDRAGHPRVFADSRESSEN
jgi:hypothetical protein